MLHQVHWTLLYKKYSINKLRFQYHTNFKTAIKIVTRLRDLLYTGRWQLYIEVCQLQEANHDMTGRRDRGRLSSFSVRVSVPSFESNTLVSSDLPELDHRSRHGKSNTVTQSRGEMFSQAANVI